MARTKIICTIGPSVNTIERMMELIDSGMNVARLNFSHGTHEEHAQAIANLKEARKRKKCPLAIMLDTKGPEIRVGKLYNNTVQLTAGTQMLLAKEALSEQHIPLTPTYVLDCLTPGMSILFDDGYISSHVLSIQSDGVLIQIDNGGILKSGKGVNIPGASLNLPAVTERDIADIHFGCDQGIDLIAASFIRSADHVLTIKRLLEEKKKSDILIIAKIENSEGVQNFDSILQAADGIMIARGDLGVEVPLSQVPILQKMMIRKCFLAGKAAVTATQMLESMIHNPRPTRAEASDVANAIYDSTSAVMLSGETAVGKYPIEAVNLMRSIIRATEEDFDYHAFFDQHAYLSYHDVPSAVTLATVKTAYNSDATAIFAFTNKGSTARLLSRLRPQMPIIAMTPNEKSYHQLALNWGVIPYLANACDTIDEAFLAISEYALSQQLVAYGDLVVVTAGTPFGISGTTNMMIVESIGDVLVRGQPGIGQRTYGKVTLVLSSEIQPYMVKQMLMVINHCDESYAPLIQECEGVILQNEIDDKQSEKNALQLAKKFNKPVVVRADGAFRTLKEGQLVTLDPDRGIVYKGAVVLDKTETRQE